MQNLSLTPRRDQHRRDESHDLSDAVAIQAFLAGVPRQRGRVVTVSSDIDSWRSKHPAIIRRLEQERIGGPR